MKTKTAPKEHIVLIVLLTTLAFATLGLCVQGAILANLGDGNGRNSLELSNTTLIHIGFTYIAAFMIGFINGRKITKNGKISETFALRAVATAWLCIWVPILAAIILSFVPARTTSFVDVGGALFWLCLLMVIAILPAVLFGGPYSVCVRFLLRNCSSLPKDREVLVSGN